MSETMSLKAGQAQIVDNAGAIEIWTGGVLRKSYGTTGNDSQTLGDSAGATKFAVKDLAGTERFSVDSDGNTTVTFDEAAGAKKVSVVNSAALEVAKIPSDGQAVLKLGDAAGAKKVAVQDSAAAERFSVNSDGGTLITLGDAAAANKLSIVNSGALEVLAVPSDGQVVVKLGDAAGAKKAAIQDNAAAERFSVNSDGGTIVTLGDAAGANKVSVVDSGAVERLAVPSDGQVVVKLSDAAGATKVSVKDSANAVVASIDSDGKIRSVASEYGEFYVAANGTATVVNAQNEQTPVAAGGTTGLVENATYSNKTGAITAFADAGAGQVTVTSAGHTLANGDWVHIKGTTNYNGYFQVANVAANTFEITDGWVANDATGTWIEGAKLKITNAGKYLAQYSLTAIASTTDKVFESMLSVNGVASAKTARRAFLTANDQTLAGQAILDLAAGDSIKLEIINRTDDVDATVSYANVSLTRVR